MLVFDQPQVSLSQVSYIDFAAAPVDICAEPSCRSVPQVSHAIVGEPAFWEINSSGETGFFFHWPIQLCQDLVSIRSDLKVVFIRGCLASSSSVSSLLSGTKSLSLSLSRISPTLDNDAMRGAAETSVSVRECLLAEATTVVGAGECAAVDAVVCDGVAAVVGDRACPVAEVTV